MTRLMFCGPCQSRHFLCGVPTLPLLSYGPVTLNIITSIIMHIYPGVTNSYSPWCLTAASTPVFWPSAGPRGSSKHFSTCPHLLAATLHYWTVIYTYIHPGFSYSMENGKVVTVLYVAISPTLNTLIDSLWDKDVKVALRKVFFFIQWMKGNGQCGIFRC